MQPAPPPSTTMVLCSDVSHRFRRGTSAISALTLEIKRGELFALLGPHAAGKTTLAQLVAGLRVPTSGQISVDDTDTRYNLPPLSTFVAYLSQQPDSIDHLTVQQQLFLPGCCAACLRMKVARPRAICWNAVIWPEWLNAPCTNWPPGSASWCVSVAL